MSARVVGSSSAASPRAASIASRAAVLSPLKLKSSPWFLSGARQRETLGIARFGEARELRPARIRQPEQPRDLVERLAGRVVERLADDPVAAEPGDLDELGVPARYEQREERELPAARRSSMLASRWPSRWCTGTAGILRPYASDDASEPPTSSAPISPGPAV